jgi:hypothetical protein
MKKSQAAKLYWFNYTARMRHEREQRQAQFKSSALTWLMAMWYKIMQAMNKVKTFTTRSDKK